MFSKIFNTILFWGICFPFSLLPLWVLYLLSDGIAFLLCHIFKYRLVTVEGNLLRSFPKLPHKEVKKIESDFYSHLADIFVEAVKELSISRRNVMHRYHCNNPEILDPYFERKQSVILVSAHYNNWEYMVLSLGMQLKHHGIGVGKRMSNKAFDKFMHIRRTRYGTEVCYADNLKQVMAKYEQDRVPCAYMLLSDQSPNDVHKCYWTEFLHQDTPVIFGAEHIAKKYNYPVFFYRVNKVKRGYYTFDIIHITDEPHKTQYGEITQKHVKLLEQTIQEAPAYWLWSHRRWKHHRPKADK
jgi:Lauroyl/myristoyl acyltransferase